MLETSILAFDATNCDVIELNLKEFVFGLVALYLGGGLVSVINVFVGVCVWKQDKIQPGDALRGMERVQSCDTKEGYLLRLRFATTNQ